MTNAEGQVSDDWLADIFNADDEDLPISVKEAGKYLQKYIRQNAA